jgi:hypothetical protein
MFNEYGKITDLIIGSPQNAMLPKFKDSFILTHQFDNILKLPYTNYNIPLHKLINVLGHNTKKQFSKALPVPGYEYPSYIIDGAKKESDNLEKILSTQYQIKCHRPDTTKLNIMHWI